MFTSFVLIVFIACTAIQLFFWLVIFSRLAFYKESGQTNSSRSDHNNPTISQSSIQQSYGSQRTKTQDPRPKTQDPTTNLPPLSIIICARNEAENLKKNLPLILAQDYPEYEVIVVNDHSTDNSLEILLAFQKKYAYFSVVLPTKIYEDHAGKKHALAEGIKKSQFSYLLLTDADCRPRSDQWANIMVQTLIRRDKKIGLGYGPYFQKLGLLNLLIRYETVYTAVQYLSFALYGMPYMGVGRNLIYRKELFDKAGGFDKHRHVQSGDDDLFVNEVANAENTTIIIHPDAFVYSEPKTTWKGYYRQKSRHLTTGKYYKPEHITLLGVLSVSHFGHYMAGIILLSWQVSILFVLVLFILRSLTIWTINFLIIKKLREPRLWGWVPVLDTMYIFYYLTFIRAIFKRNTNYWK